MGDLITVCGGCREGAGAALADRLRAAGAAVRLADCLNACGAPLALAVTGPGKATYLFGNVDPATQAGEILAFAALYAADPQGTVDDARACGRLRSCLRGRIPA